MPPLSIRAAARRTAWPWLLLTVTKVAARRSNSTYPSACQAEAKLRACRILGLLEQECLFLPDLQMWPSVIGSSDFELNRRLSFVLEERKGFYLFWIWLPQSDSMPERGLALAHHITDHRTVYSAHSFNHWANLCNLFVGFLAGVGRGKMP